MMYTHISQSITIMLPGLFLNIFSGERWLKVTPTPHSMTILDATELHTFKWLTVNVMSHIFYHNKEQ